MEKLNYLLKRTASASIDLLIFALLSKAFEHLIGNKIDGKYYTDSGVVLLLFYSYNILQEIFMGKSVGKYLLKLEIKFADEQNIQGYRRCFKIILRRLFDIIDLVCPLIYLGFMSFTKKNQKLGDIVAKMIVVKE